MSIPQDITIQILSCLPVKSLIRFKCVSKFYNTIVTESYFVDLHSSNYSKINRVIGFVDGVFYSTQEEEDEEDGNATKSYQLDNFATGEVRYLPYLKCYDGSYGICSIGFEPKENEYKVLLTINKRAWVFTLGIDNSWREIISYGEHDYYISDLGYGHCIISGILYRFSFPREFCIVAFDIKSEIFTTITMSIEFHNSIDMYNFDEFG
ncbi:hypothetical protein MTR67_011383 [Solanum verrucosum]|uniref:F-box domain-containing protein n=1 Tax=Solanum verrucosum TaxID=315347 RepID=A0AAF0Q7X0_SOLVR|nr:hypothetical protein MTR67_011383 [Solanum verrucosum]